MNLIKKILLVLFIYIFLSVSLGKVSSEDKVCNSLEECNNKIQEYEKNINELKGQTKTLNSAISYLNNKINLTTSQIAVIEQELKILETEIGSLSGKIEIISSTITEVAKILSSRIEATYKRGRLEPYLLFFNTHGFSDLITRLEYLKTAQLHDRELLISMQKSKMDYDEQKNLKEEKQAQEAALKKQLLVQQNSLAQQKQSKQDLLIVTKNDEQRFQQLLSQARQEMEAIQSIIAGKGEETRVGDINEGARIATIISGSSACSTGTHLHFEVTVDKTNANPASYLKSKDVHWELCGWYGCDSSFGFSGSWNWPMNDPITVTQGYGMTAYARSGAYGGGPHTGIDFFADDLGVNSVKNGVLYRGSIACGGGTLRYVKLEHKDSNINTYYLHVNYY